MRVDFYWHKYKYLPYEQMLAYRELMALFEREPVDLPYGLSIEVEKDWEILASRTTYFRQAVAEDGTQIVPLQTVLETSANGKFQYELFNYDASPSLRRQSTRYSAHGLHEYRGKFNPQIVRVLGNILGLQPGDWVFDPFCGSGTTLLEAAHIGWNAIGVDLNPLAVQIARAKIAAMCVSLTELHNHIETQEQRLYRRLGGRSFERAFSRDEIQMIGGKGWENRLRNFSYLQAWFTESVLIQLYVVLDEIALLPSEEVQLILRIILSDILREVSLQEPADLRIRRRKNPPVNAPVIPLYLNAVKNKIETISRARRYITAITTTQNALLGDIRYGASIVRSHLEVEKSNRFDAAITSPPYATALPYIDAQRLSLVLLGLVEADKILATERSLIGNREINTKMRLEIERHMKTNSERMPAECLSLCRELYNSIDESKDGFRRQNTPALIYKYFTDMASMFRQVRQLLKTDSSFALIVGRNKTKLGGRAFVIDTPRLLASLAEQNGFELKKAIELNTYQRFDIHQNNSIDSETLIILRAVEYEN